LFPSETDEDGPRRVAKSAEEIPERSGVDWLAGGQGDTATAGQSEGCCEERCP
jgi:hypothetical protein